MNFDVAQLCRDLEAAPTRGYDLLRWAASPETTAQVLQNPLLQASRDQLQRAAAELRGKDMPVLPFQRFKMFDTAGERLSYENRFFARRRILLVAALSAWLHRDPADVAVLEDCMWALCDDFSWSLPAHMHGDSLRGDRLAESATTLDLFACETGLALAEVCALLGDVLHPVVVERARAEVLQRVVDGYVHQATIQSWELMENNWCAVCAGGIGGAAMLLVEDDRKLAAILRNLLPAIDRFLAGFSEDGACTEGLNYWTYGVSFFVVFAELLSRRTAGKLDLLSDSRFAPVAAFQQHCFFPGPGTLTFSDVDANDKFRPGVTCFLAEYFPEVTVPPLESAMDIMHSHTYNFAPALCDMLWTSNTLVSKQTQPKPCMVYPKAQWLLCSGHDETGFAAKAGHNDEEHNHNDVGSFFLSKHGVMLLCDIGKGAYTKSYFGPGRYDIFCNSSQSHNVPIVDGQGQRHGREFCAQNVTFDHPHGAMTMDIAPAYGVSGLSSLQRHVSFDYKTGTLTLRDEIKVSRLMEVIERFVSFVQPRIDADENGGAAVILEQGRSSCTLRATTTQATTAQQRAPPPPRIRRTGHVNHRGVSVDVYTIDFPLRVEDDVVFDLVVS